MCISTHCLQCVFDLLSNMHKFIHLNTLRNSAIRDHFSSAVIPVGNSLLADTGGPKVVMLLPPAFSVGICSGTVVGGNEVPNYKMSHWLWWHDSWQLFNNALLGRDFIVIIEIRPKDLWVHSIANGAVTLQRFTPALAHLFEKVTSNSNTSNLLQSLSIPNDKQKHGKPFSSVGLAFN